MTLYGGEKNNIIVTETGGDYDAVRIKGDVTCAVPVPARDSIVLRQVRRK